jgi:two-component system phosphate regulon sensor histidine kinase PhoR
MNGIAKEEDIPDFVRKIKDESDRLINLIEDILLLSGLDEGKVDASREDVDVGEVAEQVRELLKEKAQQNDIQIDISVRGNPLLHANPSHMQELLMNIMDNAVKYNKKGGRVEVSIERLEENLLLQIHDTGIGIEPAKQARVFERFYRVDPSRSKRSGGTGLGLAIAKHICLLYGATITLESLPGEGTTIKILFA